MIENKDSDCSELQSLIQTLKLDIQYEVHRSEEKDKQIIILNEFINNITDRLIYSFNS